MRCGGACQHLGPTPPQPLSQSPLPGMTLTSEPISTLAAFHRQARLGMSSNGLATLLSPPPPPSAWPKGSPRASHGPRDEEGLRQA